VRNAEFAIREQMYHESLALAAMRAEWEASAADIVDDSDSENEEDSKTQRNTKRPSVKAGAVALKATVDGDKKEQDASKTNEAPKEAQTEQTSSAVQQAKDEGTPGSRKKASRDAKQIQDGLQPTLRRDRGPKRPAQDDGRDAATAGGEQEGGSSKGTLKSTSGSLLSSVSKLSGEAPVPADEGDQQAVRDHGDGDDEGDDKAATVPGTVPEHPSRGVKASGHTPANALASRRRAGSDMYATPARGGAEGGAKSVRRATVAGAGFGLPMYDDDQQTRASFREAVGSACEAVLDARAPGMGIYEVDDIAVPAHRSPRTLKLVDASRRRVCLNRDGNGRYTSGPAWRVPMRDDNCVRSEADIGHVPRIEVWNPHTHNSAWPEDTAIYVSGGNMSCGNVGGGNVDERRDDSCTTRHACSGETAIYVSGGNMGSKRGAKPGSLTKKTSKKKTRENKAAYRVEVVSRLCVCVCAVFAYTHIHMRYICRYLHTYTHIPPLPLITTHIHIRAHTYTHTHMCRVKTASSVYNPKRKRTTARRRRRRLSTTRRGP
jgi:hypothetical protein